MNRLFSVAIAAIATLSLAQASVAGDFTTEVHDLLITLAVGENVDTVASGTKSSAYTSVATMHDYTRIGWDPVLEGTAKYVDTMAKSYESNACATFGSLGAATDCEPQQ